MASFAKNFYKSLTSVKDFSNSRRQVSSSTLSQAKLGRAVGLQSNADLKKSHFSRTYSGKLKHRRRASTYADVSEGVSTSEPEIAAIEHQSDGSRLYLFSEPKSNENQLSDNGSANRESAEIKDGSDAKNGHTVPQAENGAASTLEEGEITDPSVGTKKRAKNVEVCETTPKKVTAEVCPLKLDIGAASISHPARVQTGSEDAYFVEGNWIGLADGISSWAEVGVNSGMYAREMMWHCLDTLRSSECEVSPKSVVIDSHEKISLQGSCTVVLAILEGIALKVANLGDSRLLVIRDGELYTKTFPMKHGFNNPFSIGADGPDEPEDAEEYTIILQPRDILLFGTDGLFDNVFESDIVSLLLEAAKAGKNAEAAAKCLAQFAHKHSNSPSEVTPFSEEAKTNGQSFEGGKKDDITVIVAYVA